MDQYTQPVILVLVFFVLKNLAENTADDFYKEKLQQKVLKLLTRQEEHIEKHDISDA